MAKRLYSAYEVCALFPGDSDDEIEMEVVNEENKEEESLDVEILDVEGDDEELIDHNQWADQKKI